MPTGSVSVSKDLVADLLAASAAFQVLVVGVESEVAARAVVYINMWPDGAVTSFGLIEDDPEGSPNNRPMVATGTSFPNGSMMVRIITDYDETAADDGAAELAAFEDTVGTIRDEMMAVAGGPGRIYCRDIRVLSVVKTDPDEYEDDDIPSALIGVLEVDWGLTG